jgi:tetratricopeptide (TPR) repeat protein
MFSERRRKREMAAAVVRGRQFVFAGDDRATLEFLEDAVQRFPEDPEIRVLLASVLLEFRPDEVVSQTAKAVELGADDPVIQVRAGHLLLGRGETDAARACAKRARELAGPDFVLMAGLEGLEGKIASLDGEYVLAEELFRSAVDREPEYSTYPVDLARFLANRDRAAEALTVIDESLKQVKEKDDLERMRRDIAGEHIRP